MALFIRMALYFVFAALASQGLVIFDADSGRVSFHVEDLTMLVSGMAAYVVTYITSRIAKARGGGT